MVKQITKTIMLILASFLLLSCGVGQKAELQVEVRVSLDGKAASQAKILLDGVESGTTDGNGYFSARIYKQPGTEVRVAVQKEAAGYEIEPWEGSLVVKLPKEGAVENYPFKIALKATKFVTLFVAENGEPLEGASIRIRNKKQGKTDHGGEYVLSYKVVPKKGLDLKVSKKGYKVWRKRVKVTPGQIVDVSLSRKQRIATLPKVQKAKPVAASKKTPVAEAKPVARRTGGKATVSVAALTEVYGVSKPVSDVAINIDGRRVGKTNASGTYTYRGKPGETIELKLTAPGHIPSEWKTSIHLLGKHTIRQFFNPAKPAPIKVGIYGYVNNTPEEDLSEVLNVIEKSVSDDLFIYSSFQEVPKVKLRQQMMDAILDLETLSTKGWQNTPLIQTVDMIISGSVTKEEQGMTIETTVNFADGKTILSQLNKVKKKKEVEDTVKLVVNNIIDQFPFEGTVNAVEGDRYRINLGRLDYRIRRGNEFKLMIAELDTSGSTKGYHEAGMLVVKENDDKSSLVEVTKLQENNNIKVGDKVVKRIYLEEERDVLKDSFILLAKSGSPPNAMPLWGVNVYLNNTWVGTTGSDGKVEVPVDLNTDHEILLSRHGYELTHNQLRVGTSKEIKEFLLEVANALFKVESEPSEAEVFVDGDLIGATPILEGKLVNFGFRKIKLSVGGDYRDWEEVLEFGEPEVDRTGENRIVFVKDHLKVGKMAEQNGNIDAAIQAYVSADRTHPDYSDARHRLAQLYMDERNDYDGAIREFENVLSLPENQQIIYKQFAVTYTNLGHAYYEKGNQLVHRDKRAAAQNLVKAVDRLKIAKQNTRFFPTQHYQEAVHDTYYYQALSYHKLFLITKKRSLRTKADLAWREYFDFFPKELERNSSFSKIRTSARKYWAQIEGL